MEVVHEDGAQDKDQHGNPVATRGGSKTDPATGLPCEIWLKNPRCWKLPASWSRCAFHHYYPPDCGDNILGFRIACSVEKK